MATRFPKWSVSLASPPFPRRQSVVRLLARKKQVLVPSRTVFEPPTDLYETQEEVIVRIEIAGLKGDSANVSVEVQDDLLKVSGEREDPAAGTARRYEQIEIETGSFERTVRLPCPVDEADASAKYDDGFLVIRFPKCRPAPSAPRSVKIE
jgi:HSP20 family protein